MNSLKFSKFTFKAFKSHTQTFLNNLDFFSKENTPQDVESELMKSGKENFVNQQSSNIISKPIRILYLGHCFQETFLKIFLDEIRSYKPKQKIEVYTVKNQGALPIFDNNTIEHGILCKGLINPQPFTSINGVDIKLINYADDDDETIIFYPPVFDKESYSNIGIIDLDWDKNNLKENIKKHTNGVEKFDAIFCCFELHFCVNWRYSLINLIDCLNKGGAFIFADISDEFKLLDGNFPDGIKESKPKVYKFFKIFNEFRNEKHYWNPEISFSNYKEVETFLSSFFYEPIDSMEGEYMGNKKDKPKFKIDFKKNTNEQVINNNSSFENYLRRGDFSYLSVGLSYNERNQLIKDLVIAKNEDDEGLDTWDTSLKYGINLYFSSGFNKEKYSNSDISWNYSTFSKDIQQLYEFNKEKLISKSLDVFANHDIVFPNHTLYTGFFSWKNAFSTLTEKIQFLINPSTFLDSSQNTLELKYKDEKHIEQGLEKRVKDIISNLWHLEKSLNAYLFQLIYNNPHIRFPISFQCLNDEFDKELLNSENFIDTKPFIIKPFKKKGAWVGYKIEYNKKGEILHLIISYSSSFGSYYLKLKELNQVIDGRSPDLKIKPIKKNTISKVEFSYNTDDDNNKESILFSKESQNIEKDLAKIWSNIIRLNNKKTINKIHRNYLLNIFRLLYNFQLNQPNYQFSFFPSKVSEKRDSSDIKKNNDKFIGLGGVFSYDKILLPSLKNKHKKLYFLMKARNKVLYRVSNLILYKAGLINYVSQDYREHARRAAIAAISARNVSHNIGSHVIPHVRSGFIKNENGIHHYNTLLDYIQQRNDFINQLASGSSNWTISVWFVKEVMARFLKQYYLLSSLAAYEELKVYDYTYYSEYYEQKWFEEPINIEKLKQYNNKVIIVGFLKESSTHKNVFFLVGEKGDEGNIRGRKISNIEIRVNFKMYTDGLRNDVFIWENYGEKINDETEFYSILRNQGNRRFKFKGTLKIGENDTWNLNDAEFIEGNLEIKIRKRKFLHKDNHGRWILEDTSKYIHKKTCINIAEQVTVNSFERIDVENILRQKEKSIEDTSSELTYFYGIIDKIDYTNNSLNLFFKKDLKVEIKDLRIRIEDLKLDENATFKEGKRIVVSGKLDEDELIITNANIEELIVIQYLILPTSESKYDMLDDEDVKVAIPGGISGFQSFYTILENVIRNAAKHNWINLPIEDKLGKNLEVKIEIADQGNDDFLICKIWTNGADLRFKAGIPKYSNYLLNEPDCYKADKAPNNWNKAINKSLNNLLVQDIIDSEGKFIMENLGSSEIKVNAAYLAAQGESLISNKLMAGESILLKDKKSESILDGYIRVSQLLERANGQTVPRLGYRFKLQKPKEICIIEGNYNNGEQLKNIFKKEIVTFFTNEEALRKENQRGLDFDFCLMFLKKEKRPHKKQRALVNIIIEILLFIFSTKKSQNKINDIKVKFEEIFARIENYPYRLFLVLKEEIHHEEVFMKFIKNSNFHEVNADSAKFQKELLFLKKRIFFLRNQKFEYILYTSKFRNAIINLTHNEILYTKNNLKSLIIEALELAFGLNNEINQKDKLLSDKLNKISSRLKRYSQLIIGLPNQKNYIEIFRKYIDFCELSNNSHLPFLKKYRADFLKINEKVYLFIDIDFKQLKLEIEKIFQLLFADDSGTEVSHLVNFENVFSSLRNYPSNEVLTLSMNKTNLVNKFHEFIQADDVTRYKNFYKAIEFENKLITLYKRVNLISGKTNGNIERFTELRSELIELFEYSFKKTSNNSINLRKKFRYIFDLISLILSYPQNSQKVNIYIQNGNYFRNKMLEFVNANVVEKWIYFKNIASMQDEFISLFQKINIYDSKNSDSILLGTQEKEHAHLIILLYNEWVKLLGGKYIYKVIVNLDKNSGDDKNQNLPPPSLPIILRNPISSSKNIDKGLQTKITTTSNFLSENLEHFDYEIQYHRHKSVSKTIDGNTKIHFLENLSGNKPSFKSFNFSCEKNENNNILKVLGTYNLVKFKLLLKENAHTSILIVDERIMNYYQRINEKKTVNSHYKNFLNSNIIIPIEFSMKLVGIEREIKVPPRKKISIEKTTQYLYNYCGPNDKPDKSCANYHLEDSIYLNYFYIPEFRDKGKGQKLKLNTIIIHQSILDKGLGTKEGKEREDTARKIIFSLKKVFASVIVTSGRSKSPLFSKFTKFLPFSVLEELMMTKDPDKLTLTQILFKTLR